MNTIINSVDNMVDRLLIISDKNRFPDRLNPIENENETPLSAELFRKLKFTAVNVMTNPEMIKAFPDGLVSAQFILINPENIKKYIINDINISFEESLEKEEKLKLFVTGLLEQSLTKNESDDKNLINLVSIYDKKEAKAMDNLSFKENQFKNINNYIKNDGDIMSLPGNNNSSLEEQLKMLDETLNSYIKYPKNLLKGEQYNQKIQKEIKVFLAHYENASSDSLKEYICGGFISKIFPEMKNFRNSTHLKIWEFIAEGAGLDLKEFTKSTIAQSFKKQVTDSNEMKHFETGIRYELSNKVKEAIALAVHPLINSDTQRTLLISGISSYSLLSGKNGAFTNILPQRMKVSRDNEEVKKSQRKTI